MKEQIICNVNQDLARAVDAFAAARPSMDRSQATELLLERALGLNAPRVAVFFMGGLGTRFRPITYEVPKALLPVQGKTVPEHLFELFKRYGVRRFVFSLGYLAPRIMDYFGDGAKWGVKIEHVVEDEPLGSAGALRLARKHLAGGPFVITNGDELKNIDIEKMFRFHREQGGLATVALTRVEDPSAYGVAALEGHKISKFVEKPSPGTAPSNYINSGLSILEPAVLDEIPEGFSMYEKDLFPKLAGQGQLHGFVFQGQWFDTGTPERYERAIKEWRGLDS
jgi:NDP-sugar pyrophosphorylase family protein